MIVAIWGYKELRLLLAARKNGEHGNCKKGWVQLSIDQSIEMFDLKHDLEFWST